MRKYLIFFIFLFLIQPTNGKIINLDDTYYDYNGNQHIYNKSNVNQYPLYRISEFSNNYTIHRMDETISIPKRNWISYNFYYDKIQPIITINDFSQINSLVTKENVNSWYITVPYTMQNVMKFNDKMIKTGLFTRTMDIELTDSVGKKYDIYPRIYDNEIRLYFNPGYFSNATWPLTITENTITVNNATTNAYTTQNITMNGSRFTGNGMLALNLNSSYLDSLVGYWSFDETTGTKIRNVNTESGYINTTNEGTWNGNTTLNYSIGKIGNAGSFDMINDYINVPKDGTLNVTNITMDVWIYPNSAGGGNFGRVINKWDGTTYQYWLLTRSPAGENSLTFTSNAFTLAANNNAIIFGQWNHVITTYNKTSANVYVNGVNVGTAAAATALAKTNSNLNFGRDSVTAGRYYDGLLDEVKILNRSLTNAEVNEYNLRSFRTSAMPLILNETTIEGNVINRTRIVYTGDTLHNISIYTKKNGTIIWNATKINAVSNTWYDITNPAKDTDFGVYMQGNGTTTPFFSSLEWDNTTVSPINYQVKVVDSTTINHIVSIKKTTAPISYSSKVVDIVNMNHIVSIKKTTAPISYSSKVVDSTTVNHIVSIKKTTAPISYSSKVVDSTTVNHIVSIKKTTAPISYSSKVVDSTTVNHIVSIKKTVAPVIYTSKVVDSTTVNHIVSIKKTVASISKSIETKQTITTINQVSIKKTVDITPTYNYKTELKQTITTINQISIKKTLSPTSMFTLSGNVNNSNGYAINGANISFNGVTTITNSTGHYSIVSIPIGSMLSATAIGYNDYSTNINLNNNLNYNFIMVEKTSSGVVESPLTSSLPYVLIVVIGIVFYIRSRTII